MELSISRRGGPKMSLKYVTQGYERAQNLSKYLALFKLDTFSSISSHSIKFDQIPIGDVTVLHHLSYFFLVLLTLISVPQQLQAQAFTVQPSPRLHSQQISHTHLAKPPVVIDLKCINCPIQPSDDQGEVEIDLSLRISFARAVQVPFQLSVDTLPQGWRLKEDLPSTLLIRSKEEVFNFKVILDQNVDFNRAQDAFKMTVLYQTEVSGLRKVLQLKNTDLIDKVADHHSRVDRPRSLQKSLQKPLPLQVPLPSQFTPPTR